MVISVFRCWTFPLKEFCFIFTITLFSSHTQEIYKTVRHQPDCKPTAQFSLWAYPWASKLLLFSRKLCQLSSSPGFLLHGTCSVISYHCFSSTYSPGPAAPIVFFAVDITIDTRGALPYPCHTSLPSASSPSALSGHIRNASRGKMTKIKTRTAKVLSRPPLTVWNSLESLGSSGNVLESYSFKANPWVPYTQLEHFSSLVTSTRLFHKSIP